jgi:cytochrome c-type biogenesis protein CcmE
LGEDLLRAKRPTFGGTKRVLLRVRFGAAVKMSRTIHRETVATVSALLIVGAAAISLSLGRSTPRLTPANVRRSSGVVALVGVVVAPPQRIRRTLSFVLSDRKRTARVRVLYSGAVPNSLRVAEQINITGVYRNGRFLADADSLTVNCGPQEHC